MTFIDTACEILQRAVAADNERWENLNTGQTTDEAGDSGYLEGYHAALLAVRDFLDANPETLNKYLISLEDEGLEYLQARLDEAVERKDEVGVLLYSTRIRNWSSATTKRPAAAPPPIDSLLTGDDFAIIREESTPEGESVADAILSELEQPPFLQLSLGHITFIPDTRQGFWEYWERDGNIYRQTTIAPVMPDGYRSGRHYITTMTNAINGLRCMGVELCGHCGNKADHACHNSELSWYTHDFVPARVAPEFRSAS